MFKKVTRRYKVNITQVSVSVKAIFILFRHRIYMHIAGKHTAITNFQSNI